MAWCECLSCALMTSMCVFDMCVDVLSRRTARVVKSMIINTLILMKWHSWSDADEHSWHRASCNLTLWCMESTLPCSSFFPCFASAVILNDSYSTQKAIVCVHNACAMSSAKNVSVWEEFIYKKYDVIPKPTFWRRAGVQLCTKHVKEVVEKSMTIQTIGNSLFWKHSRAHATHTPTHRCHLDYHQNLELMNHLVWKDNSFAFVKGTCYREPSTSISIKTLKIRWFMQTSNSHWGCSWLICVASLGQRCQIWRNTPSLNICICWTCQNWAHNCGHFNCFS